MTETPKDNEDQKQLTCSICFYPIQVKNGWNGGNNAEPINDGRCCDDCNTRVVIPARIRQMMG